MQPAGQQQDTSICVSEKRMSQWENIMRKFSRAHEEECRQTVLKIPLARRSTKLFPTGSQYKGTWDVLGMSGLGIYTFPNGVIYEGDFVDGMFHGIGQLKYPDGTVVRGHFEKGVMTQRNLVFSDGLKYEEDNWKYCKMPDRRYTQEYEKGIKPAGVCHITPTMPPRDIPPGYYDTGDGVYSPETKSVYKADDLTAMLRSPSAHEQRWIMDNCRTAPESVLGPRPDLYEDWSEPYLMFPNYPPPAASTLLMLNRKREYSNDSISYYRASKSELDTRKSNLSRTRFKCHDQGNDGLSAASVHREIPVSSKDSRKSNTLQRIRNYNLKFKNEDTSTNFPAIPKSYSGLFNKNINVALATIYQNPNEAAFKQSYATNAKSAKETAKTEIQNENRDAKINDVLGNDFGDMLKECSKDFDANILKRSKDCVENQPKNLGLTTNVMMFEKVDKVMFEKVDGDDLISRKSSGISEEQVNTWDTMRNELIDSIYDNAEQ